MGMLARAGASLYAKKLKEPGATKVDTQKFAHDFAEALGGKPFLHGDKPGQADISFFATCAPWANLHSERLTEVIDSAGLREWWRRMERATPLDKFYKKEPSGASKL